jgi:hypothetical protein
VLNLLVNAVSQNKES